MQWHSSPRTRKLRLSHVFSMSNSFQCLVHQQICSVIVTQTSHLHWLKSSAQPLAFISAGLLHTMHNAMDAFPNDWKVSHGQEGSKGTTPPWTSTGLQQYKICGHRVLTPLSHVWEVTSPPCRLFLPHNRHKYKSLSYPHLCGRGAKALQRGLCWGPVPVQQWSRQKHNYDKSMSTV